jgi:hypothetical protein
MTTRYHFRDPAPMGLFKIILPDFCEIASKDSVTDTMRSQERIWPRTG